MGNDSAKQVVIKDLRDVERFQICEGKVVNQRMAKLFVEDGRCIPVSLYENEQGLVAITDNNGIISLRSDNERRLSELKDNDTFSILEVIVKDN